jgi:peptidyl-dipeptidase Dcp
MSRSDNPLLKPSPLPFEAPDFDAIKTEHFLPALKETLKEARAEILAITNNPDRPTFENTIEAIEFSGMKMNSICQLFNALAEVRNDDESSEIESEFFTRQERYENWLTANNKLFARVKEVYDERESLTLTIEQRQLLNDIYTAFIDSGALLGHRNQKDLRRIYERLAQLSVEFMNNVVKSTDRFSKIIDDENDLAGIPEHIKETYRHAAEEQGFTGQWLIKLSPNPKELLIYADNRVLREEIYRANNHIGYGDEYDNSDNIMETLRLRHRLAQTLGKENNNFADFVLEDRILNNTQDVFELLKKNESIYRPAMEARLQAVRDFARETDGITDFQPWDYKYYDRKLQEQTFGLKLDNVRPYFELQHVIEGLHAHIEKFFNVKIQKANDKYPVYHPDVKAFEIHDNESGEMIGLLYGDYYARPGEKNGGGFINVIRDRGLYNGIDTGAIVSMAYNLPKSPEGGSTLLSLEDVKFLFHEMGHVMHAMKAKGRYPGQNGVNVSCDFMEVMSYFVEETAMIKDVMTAYAIHHETGEPLPGNVIDKIIEIEKINDIYTSLYYNYLSFLDMTLHTTDPASITSIGDLEDNVIRDHWIFPRVGGGDSHQFDQLFADAYAAGFHSYEFDIALVADLLEDFSGDIYDRAKADHLVKAIFTDGGARPPLDQIRAAKGRDPDMNVIFRRRGLTFD